MAKKIISIIGAIVALAGIALGVFLIVRKLLSKNCRCHEEVEFENYVECPCCGSDDDGELDEDQSDVADETQKTSDNSEDTVD